MDYPDKITEVGALNQSEVFYYFKKAFLEVSWNPEQWPYYRELNTGEGPPAPIVNFVDTAPSLPMSRGQFYNWIENYTRIGNLSLPNWIQPFQKINNQFVYTPTSIDESWTILAVNHWGKVKSLELGIFGSVGGSESDMSIIGSGSLRSTTLNMVHSDLNYLRYALSNFTYYYTSYVMNNYLPTPTNPVHNISNRSFGWTNVPGFPNRSDYQI